jgi:hypothetical protein
MSLSAQRPAPSRSAQQLRAALGRAPPCQVKNRAFVHEMPGVTLGSNLFC